MNSKSSITQQRILAAAGELFSKQGYNGTSTRDVATLADVNEVTIYRYYPCKRDLFMAALESELAQIMIDADSITALANAADARTAVSCLFGMITSLVVRHPKLVRLLQFSALEMGDGLEPLCRKYLAGLIDVSATYLKRWMDSGELHFHDPKLTVLAFVATVVGVDSYYPVMWGGNSPLPREVQTNVCAELWKTVLTSNTVA